MVELSTPLPASKSLLAWSLCFQFLNIQLLTRIASVSSWFYTVAQSSLSRQRIHSIQLKLMSRAHALVLHSNLHSLKKQRRCKQSYLKWLSQFTCVSVERGTSGPRKELHKNDRAQQLFIAHCRCIFYLEMTGHYSHDFIDAIMCSPSLSTLISLTLNNCSFDGNEWEFTTDLKFQLRSLTIQNCVNATTRGCNRLIRHCTYLQQFSLVECSLDSRYYINVLSAICSPHLTYLALECVCVLDLHSPYIDDLCHLIAKKCKLLKTLILTNSVSKTMDLSCFYCECPDLIYIETDVSLNSQKKSPPSSCAISSTHDTHSNCAIC
ncbi:MAG: hypothetical protein Sylvanvirus21_6 [Sylvanvirus sp.]|uniref:Uncharacterized protein n=1 Tax=Sylvanvirus sp. TaxID=2487774 RepID=A0A3G5AJQ8_9VIRU|nr:MAG: hypothetical protein Sylvanvirus21_6 [Sylvanvirus sp.]